jgi:hypothetical protein
MEHLGTFTAFVGDSIIAAGPLPEILPCLKHSFDKDPGAMILTFNDRTGEQVDFDLRGTLADILTGTAEQEPRLGPGRPKLGVISREISLLPRHWDWLQEQSNGASAAIRRLIDEERKRQPDALARRLSAKATGRVMSAIAGNLPGYEEASRALYSGHGEHFRESTGEWPSDIRSYVERLATPAFNRQ